MTKISAVVSVYNAEGKIEKCLKSLAFADEIIVVNNSSTDKTLEKVKKLASKVFTKENNPMLNVNKNFGFSKTQFEWIINLDADEEVSDELKLEIKNIVESNPSENGFWIPRKNIIFGKWIKHAGWYPDYQLRLFRKSKGGFEEKHVHEMIKVDGETGYLKGEIIHYHYQAINEFIEKHYRIYAPNEAAQLAEAGYKFNWLDSIRMPFNEFISRFFAREGYKDGFHGLMLSLLMSFYHLLIFSLLWEKNKFESQEDGNILPDIKKEIDKSAKDLKYWFLNEKIKSSKSSIKKIMLRAKRKFSS